VKVPPVCAAGALLGAADELLVAGDDVALVGAAELGAAALVLVLAGVELAVLACFLLDEHAELRSARAILAAAILAHRCLAFISLS